MTAARCVGRCSALHPSSQRAASVIAAPCVGRLTRRRFPSDCFLGRNRPCCQGCCGCRTASLHGSVSNCGTVMMEWQNRLPSGTEGGCAPILKDVSEEGDFPPPFLPAALLPWRKAEQAAFRALLGSCLAFYC